jgi:ferredoxin-2, mitochondrial
MIHRGIRRLVKFEFLLRDGKTRQVVDAPKGISVLKAAHMFGVELEGACEESMACSTCHVILEETLFDALPQATEREEDLLDLAPGLTDTSRLGCQIRVGDLLEGKTIRLPKQTVNFYVDGHTPRPH